MPMTNFLQDPWYLLICDFYGDQRSQRSGVLLINHIDEGLTILEIIGATDNAKRAYCIHPMIQEDTALEEWFNGSDRMNNLYGLDHNVEVITLAMEYRYIANSCLSDRMITDAKEIHLSPLAEVNDMLVADKIQNRKDFELYHKKSHLRQKELDRYFKFWLERLGISEEKYQEFAKMLQVRSGKPKCF